MGLIGRSPGLLVAVLPIFLTTSMPSTTSPKTLCLLSSHDVSRQRDEELAAVGVGSAVGHRQDARLGVPQRRMELVREVVAGPARALARADRRPES